MKPIGLPTVLLALALAASSGVAAAQGFGSVSSGKRLPDDATPVATESPAAAATPPAASESPAAVATTPDVSESPAAVATAPAATGTPGAFTTAPAAPCEHPNPFMSDPRLACQGQAAFAPAPEPDCAAPNPFMTGTAAAACAASNPFVPGEPGAGGEPGPAQGSTGTSPFGGAFADAIAAGPPRLEVADRILVKKSQRRLYLLNSDRVVREYPIRLGLNPYGHKQREGDFRTPEGVYRLSRRNTHSDFFLSLEVSYPNEVDRERARLSGVRPGGLIMIHGQPNVPRKPPDYYASNDWTDGCIAVSNSDMVDIWMRTSIGTTIEIRP